MRRLLTILAAAAAAAVAASAAAAAADGPALTPVERLPFPARGFVVDLPADARIEPGTIRVLENGRPVRNLDVSPIGQAGIHFGVVLAVDASESMTGKPLAAAVGAARSFVSKLEPGEQVGVIAFNGRVSVLQRPTSSRARLAAATADAPAVAYGTRAYDAVERALSVLAGARLSTGSVVLLSDGADLGSRTTLDEVVRKARARHVRIFTIGLRSGAFDGAALRRLADESGGTYAEASSVAALAPVFAALRERLASEYLIRYRSDAAPKSSVRVEVNVGSAGSAERRYIAPTPAGLKPFHRSLVSRVVLSPAAVLMLALAVALLAAVAIRSLVRPRGETLVDRVEAFAADGRKPRAEPRRTVAAGARRVRRSGWFGRLERRLEIARIEMPAGRVVVLTAAATAVVTGLLALASPLFALLGLLTPLVTRSLISSKLKRVRNAFADQLAPNLQVLASALRVGHSFIGALDVVAENAHEPSRSELRRVLADEQLGVPVDEAIQRVADRMANRDLEQVALLAELQRTAGGNAAEVLDTVVATLRERADVRRLVTTLTAQGRLARWILTALPLVVALAVFVLNGDAVRPLYQSSVGQLFLVAGALMLVAGSLVIQRIVDIDV